MAAAAFVPLALKAVNAIFDQDNKHGDRILAPMDKLPSKDRKKRKLEQKESRDREKRQSHRERPSSGGGVEPRRSSRRSNRRPPLPADRVHVDPRDHQSRDVRKRDLEKERYIREWDRERWMAETEETGMRSGGSSYREYDGEEERRSKRKSAARRPDYVDVLGGTAPAPQKKRTW